MSKQATPMRYQDGDYSDLECVTHGIVPHIYRGKIDAWACSSCGNLDYPTEPPTPHRLKEPVYAEPWRPPTQPTGVRIRRSDGSSEILQLIGNFEVVVRKVGSTSIEGVEHPLVRGSAHEFASITFTYPKEQK